MSVVREGDVIECRGECRGNQRHFLVTSRGRSFTVKGKSGCFLEKGAGAATLGGLLTGPGGQGLLHFCDGAAADCDVTTPDKGREWVHVDS